MTKQNNGKPTLKPQAAKPAHRNPVAEAERVIADLEAQREQLVAQRAKDDEETKAVSYRAHALHEVGATSALSEITGRAIERDQRLRSLDLAIAEAKQRLATAEHEAARRLIRSPRRRGRERIQES
jgi:hypothetical protein